MPRWRVLVLVGAVVVVASACIGPHRVTSRPSADLDESDVVGEWRNLENGAMLDFEGDGDFTATNLPYQMFDEFPEDLPPGFDPAADKLPASGEWLLRRPIGSDNGPRNRITLRIALLSGRENRGSFNLRAEQQGSAVVIAYYVGDPDLQNRIVYERCEPSCQTVRPSGSGE